MKKVVLITLLWFSVILLFSQTGQIESLQQQQQALQEEIKKYQQALSGCKKTDNHYP